MAVNDGGDKLYVAGAANMDAWNAIHEEDPISSNAVLLVINTADLNTNTSSSVAYSLIDVPGRVSKDVVAKGGKVAVVSGDDGVAAVYDEGDIIQL
ncbi:MAG: hypothetical protein ACK5MI_04580 [Mangrovibacterium sp.]